MKASLFAPWRMEFIETYESKETCVFCSLPKAERDRESYILARGKYSYVILNKFPYTHGHLMAVPYRHIKDWTQLSRDELLEMNEFTQTAVRLLKENFMSDGFNIGVNLGKAAGAGIEDHVHQHIVPRWFGDFNFMPLFSEVKVISEHLSQTYERLASAWQSGGIQK